MKPSDVASEIGVSPVTVRSWSNEFASFLSPTGAGGAGRHRDFTETDRRVLTYIKDQRAMGRQRDEIALALRAMADDGELEALPMSVHRIEAQVPAVPAVLVDETRRSMMRENAVLQERIVKLEQQLEISQGDKEQLLRELADMNGKLQRALLTAELYESGRLKSNL